ncbi:MAG: hypothetical protein KDE28_02185, partial [Anaerolineales bacterium]|nr:hypothetical protein [Anaerolineales bacterium]
MSHNQAAVSRALKLTSLNLSSLKIPVARVDAFRIPITQQKTILLDDIVETTRQFLPGPLRGLAPRVVKILNVPKSINAPMMVTGGV